MLPASFRTPAWPRRSLTCSHQTRSGPTPRSGQYRFDIDKLSVRVIALTDWLLGHDATAGLSVGLFGASTGAAAALVAAAARPFTVEAVVSRGGRPDLAGEFLRLVFQPTLLIVGGRDATVIELNRMAAPLLPGETRLDIVPGATHLFEEAGTLEQVARLARDWFRRHLKPVPRRERSAPLTHLKGGLPNG